MRIFLLVALFICAAIPSSTEAARFYFVSPEGAATRMPIEVRIDTEGEQLNAFEGTVTLAGSSVRTVRAEDGGSVITVWLEHPEQSSTIRFSGITPGGYQGDGLLFTLVAEGTGEARLSFSGVRAYRNDGEGTEVSGKAESLRFSFGEGQRNEAEDHEPPEPFSLGIASTPDGFEGKDVLVFQAQDKATGIERYEVCEGFAACSAARSPYTLEHPEGFFFRVTAYDFAGNERAAILFTDTAKTYAAGGLGALILIVGAGIYLARRRFHAR